MSRPTSYKEDYVKLAYNYCIMGADDKKLAEFFEVTVTTVNNWKNQYPEFLESIKKGKDIYDTGTVEKSLLDRANGYTHEEVKLFQFYDKESGEVKIKEHTIAKHYPPDPTSMIFWLKNRNPARWRDKMELVGKFDVNNFDVKLTPEEEAAYKERLAGMYGSGILGGDGETNSDKEHEE